MINDKVKLVIQLFEEEDPGSFTKYLNNCRDPKRIIDLIAHNNSCESRLRVGNMYGGFNWCMSEEGYEYWSSLIHRVECMYSDMGGSRL